MYGRGENSIAEQLGCDVTEAKTIKDDVYKAFPAIKNFEQASLEMATTKGYVTTLWGRKRRLPILRADKYTVSWTAAELKERHANGIMDDSVPESVYAPYIAKLDKLESDVKRSGRKFVSFKQKKAIYDMAETVAHVIIHSTEKDKADATRQVINSRVQGSAADMSKKAMIKVNTDKKLRELGGQIVIPVHDELILHAPLRNARVVRDMFAHDMETAATDKLEIPIACDVTCSFNWYGPELDLDEELKGLVDA